MKAWEARQILEGLDPQQEVTLTIGRKRQTVKPPQFHDYVCNYPLFQKPQWISDYETKQGTIKCH